MRIIVFIILSCFCFGVPAQETLTIEDAKCLNEIFSDERGDFSFENKNIIFTSGSTGYGIIDKDWYFNEIKFKKENHRSENIVQKLYVLKDYDIENKGVDVIVAYYVKVPYNKRRIKKVLKKVKTNY